MTSVKNYTIPKSKAKITIMRKLLLTKLFILTVFLSVGQSLEGPRTAKYNSDGVAVWAKTSNDDDIPKMT